MAIVVIDPGHGGKTEIGGSSANNAIGPNGTLEKNLTLKVALATQAALRSAGVDVRLTRTTDVNIGLAQRARIAKAASADAFLSIHFNAFNGVAQGTETWVGTGASQLSRTFARKVQNCVLAVTGYADRGVQQKQLGVLRPSDHAAKTVAALVEISFMDVTADERRLSDVAYIGKLGKGLSAGICDYLASIGALESADETVEMAMGDEDGFRGAKRRRRRSQRDAQDNLSFEAFDADAPANPLEMPSFDVDVPFIEYGDSSRSYGDIGTESALDDPVHMTAGWRSIRNQVKLGPDFEVIIGRDTSLPSTFLPVLADRRRAVGKIITSGVNYKGESGRWSGTGFLVGKNLLLTNHHVLNSAQVAEQATVDFEFELPTAEFLAGVAEPKVNDNGPGGTGRRTFRLDPRRLFLTSPATDGGLDYSFVWIEDEAAQTFGTIPLQRSSHTVYENEQAFIVHHPQGRAKRVSLDDTDVVMLNTTVIRYTSDTMKGSSGSPVFNRQGRLIALHHASRPSDIARDDGVKLDVLNEGIKISAIVIDLERRRSGSERAMIEDVLGAARGSDTMTGFFGALGRDRKADGKTGVEAVIDTYRGTEADIDIGFWNIEWLSKRYTDPEKLRMAAAQIADLSLDIWGLCEISPAAVRALVGELKSQFGEIYDCAFSEPDAPDGKQSTAVMWKTKTVSGSREEWPDDIERLWHLDSRDTLETEDGKIFNRYPGLFRFDAQHAGRTVEFHLVPLHLKAMDEGQKRRRLASKLLARAVREMREKHNCQGDWVIGGDFNAELASRDFDALLDGEPFKAMSAEDEQNGAMSYIKSPQSLIDHIFLSPNLARRVGDDGFFIIASEKSVDDYVRKLSDHRPVLIRLALGDKPVESQDELDDMVDRLFASTSLSRGPRPSSRSRISADLGLQSTTVTTYKRTSKQRPAAVVHESAWTDDDDGVSATELEATGYTLISTGLTKQAFLSKNVDELTRMIGDVNEKLRADHGAAALPVSMLDFAVMLNCEAGMKNGKVDPKHEHSLGERGLFPLPDNVKFWNGAGAPNTNVLMPLDVNVYHFILYLGRLKNKVEPGMALYNTLFQYPGIKGVAKRESRLLAGIVHGYFEKAKYAGAPVPKTKILNGYATDVPLAELMADTNYVHAGSPLMVGRQENIEAGLGWVAALAPEYAVEAPFEGARSPDEYLVFASSWTKIASQLGVNLAGVDEDDADAVALKVLNHVARKNPDRSLLVGFDAGNLDGGGMSRSLAKARELRASLMVYVEGPGGPTDGEWSDDERGRIKAAARSVGVDVSKPEGQWFRTWTNKKWREFTFNQLAEFKDNGFSAAEIDNLYQVVGEGDDPGSIPKLLALLDTYQVGVVAGQLPRLVLKNLTGPQLKAIAAAIIEGRLERETFADFHIAENGTGNPTEQRNEAAKMGIRTIRSTDTNAYTAFGEFELDEAYSAFVAATS